jgi:hypothetical protein
MPTKTAKERASEDARAGKSPSTQAGEFVREEIDEIRAGEHGARSPQQAIAIGLSKARRAGVKLPPPKPGKTSEGTRKQARRELAQSQRGETHTPNPKRSRAAKKALQRESTSSASTRALSQHARAAARKRQSEGPITERTQKRPGARRSHARQA